MQSINDLSSYEIDQADRWEPLKSLITGPGALLQRALTAPTASPQGLRYKTFIQPTVEDICKNTLKITFDFFTVFDCYPNFGIGDFVAGTTPVALIEQTLTFRQGIPSGHSY